MIRKLFTIGALAGFCMAVNAQSKGGVVLNVKLHPIQTLVVNKSQNEVNLNYVTKEDYAGGVISKQADHLTIYSTSGFQVKVKSSVQLSGTQQNIASNTISVTPSAGSKPLPNANYISRKLSSEEQSIISSTTGGSDRNFTIDYSGAGGDAYINYYNSSENTSVYTTEVLYTIIAQ